MKRLLALLATLLTLAGLTGCARAESLVSVTVLDVERQEHLPQYPFRGRDYIEGRPGHRYAVVLQNLTGERVLAVVSVDGVNAISGQTAGAQQSGYVLEPWQRLEVRGWRKNLSEIAEFHFTSLGDSYAARTGRPQNVGVIGVAAFRERRYPAYPPANISQPAPTYPPSPWDGMRDRAEASPEAQSAPSPTAPPPARAGSGALAGAAADAAAPAMESRREADYGGGYAPAPRQQLGTGHGQRRWDAASMTTFERAGSRPNQVATLYYDAAESLVARGILPPRWPQPSPVAPDAFPVGFAPDPY